MFDISHLSKSYGPNTVLNDVSFSMYSGMRAGLVGTNGVGKSTLLKILAGLEIADSGEITLSSATRLGYLPQNLPNIPDQTIDELIVQSIGELRETEIRMKQLELSMANADKNRLADLMAEYSDLSNKFQENGGYEIDHKISIVMEGLGIGYLERSRRVDTLSGGEKTRVNLATLLLQAPDMMLLDEPTNNLDSKSLEWLETYLRGYREAIIAASHDRQFLNNVVSVIFEIDEHTHQLKKYTGNYDAYKVAKNAERAKWEEEYKSQQEEISELRKSIKASVASVRSTGRHRKPRDGDKFIPYFKGQRVQESVSRSISDAEKRLKRIQENPIPKPPKPLRIKPNLQLQDIKSSEVIRVSEIFKSFGERNILQNISFSLRHDSRVVIIGQNGIGKTTLLRIIAGQIQPDNGKISFSPSARLGVLVQEPELTNPDKTVLEYYRQGLTGYIEDFIFGLVTCGLFRYEELNKKVGQLSLGQVRKLQIARMIATKPNVLILDEPTNHISLDVLESFEEAIKDFQGPVLAVSHDRRFIQQFGGEVWELTERKLLNHGESVSQI